MGHHRKKKKGNSTGGAGTKLLRICPAIYQQETFVFLYDFFTTIPRYR